MQLNFNRILPYLLPLSYLYLVFSIIWSIQHWIESPLPQQIGFLLVAVFYALRYWRKSNIRYTDTIKCVLVVFWCGLKTCFASGVLFDPVVFYALFLIGIVWIVAEIIDLFKGRTRGHRLILLLGGALIGLQVIMRIERIGGAVIPMVLSWMVLSLGFVLELIVLSMRKTRESSSP